MRELRIIVNITGPPTEEQKRQERQDNLSFGKYLYQTVIQKNGRATGNDSENHRDKRAGFQANKAG